VPERKEAFDLEVLAMWRRPAGTLDPWVRAVVGFAGVLTIAIAGIGARSWNAHNSGAAHIRPFWIHNALALALALWIAATLIPSWRLSRWVRMAVLLPVAHVIAMVAVWKLWGWLSLRTASSVQMVIYRVPIAATIAIAGGLLVAGAWLVTRGRRREGVHAAVMLALVQLLALGLWLPIGSRIWCRIAGWQDYSFALNGLEHPLSVAAFLLVPPFVVALGFTAVAMRRPHAIQAASSQLVFLMVGLFVSACVCRMGGPEGPFLVFINFVHVLCAAAVLAVGAMATLGVTTWLRDRHARRALASERSPRTGMVIDDPELPGIVASIETTSWLRGPRPVVHAFTVATKTGNLRVPAGACWVAPLPALTTQLRADEAMVALRSGDRVVLAGYVDADPTHPFRDSAAPLPGPGGILVGRPDDQRYGLANIALTLWRPCVAYLLILVAAGAPAIAGALVFM
jgi:hypothetical protein